MKRIISFVLCLGVLLAIPTACQAVEKEFGPDRMYVLRRILWKKYSTHLNYQNYKFIL